MSTSSATWPTMVVDIYVPRTIGQPRCLRGLRRSLVHSLMIARHCVLRNWDRIPVRALKGLLSRGGMVSICPLL